MGFAGLGDEFVFFNVLEAFEAFILKNSMTQFVF